MFWWKKQTDEFWRDVTSLCGPGLYFITVLTFYLINKKNIALQLFIGFAITYAAGAAIKIIYFKDRPKKEKYHSIPEKIDAGAFPSIHSARAIFVALTLAKNFDLQQARLLFFALAAAISYSRIAIKKHYLIDVIGGLVIGILTFILINRTL